MILQCSTSGKCRMFSKLIINKYHNGKDTQTTEIIFREHILNECLQRETIYGTWRNGEVIQPIKEQRLTVNVVNRCFQNEIDFKAITFNIDANQSVENSSGHSSDCNLQNDIQLTQENRTGGSNTELKHKRKIDLISDFLIKKAYGEVRESNENLSTEILDKNLGKICKNNEIILKNIYILNEKLQYLKKKEIEESTVARLANVSHICEKCGSAFSKYATFQYHMKTHRLRGKASKVREYHYSTRPVNSKINPVWVCPFCYQAWPNQSSLHKHLFASQCNFHMEESESKISLEMIFHQAIKRHISQLMHCEFCEKVFTNITKVLKHQKAHRTDKNYQCTWCNLTFTNYLDVVNHWNGDCQWKKVKYVFTQPKYLICNVCYEKFDSWDNLYLHRYEYEHFILKCKKKEEIKNEEEAEFSLVGYKKGKGKKAIMKYECVLQCEGCGNVYMMEDQLTQHREEIHLQKLCQICGHISACKKNFAEHMKDHNL